MVSVEQVIRIELKKNDTDTISNKTFDFSRTTIRNLIRDGYNETLDQETQILKVGTLNTQDDMILVVMCLLQYNVFFHYHILLIYSF
ncbi:MAG: hypothetical protein P0116_14755 [Candidatus Nitrosocosmicus sp.]|nr:hypothetical protein [Candidatus Nitrosocosmicus sp.]